MNKKIKMLVAKPGLDGHDRGLKVIANAFAAVNMGVVYLGIHQTPESIVDAAVEHGVDGIAISFLTGAHMVLLPRIIKLLGARKKANLPIIVGGIIPSEDVKCLRCYRNVKYFAPGVPIDEVTGYISSKIK